jgi:hypothetical protein
MFILWSLLTRYPRMYSTPPEPENEDEELEDTTLIQILQLPDALTFIALVAGSITLPMKMDESFKHSWNTAFIPFYFAFLAPLISLGIARSREWIFLYLILY